MSKATPIDRLALTRAKFGGKMYGDEPGTSSYRPQCEGDEYCTPPEVEEHRAGYSKCPSCGQETLIHEDGCKHCRSCGWSACG